MFGCTAVYARGKIVLILREKASAPADNGVWIATTAEHHASLRAVLPSMRPITVFGEGGGWQVVPVEADGFEEEVLRACALVRADDARIGKVPKAKAAPGASAGKKAAAAKKKKKAAATKKAAKKRTAKRA
jgi:hypothetical protein